jgi:ribonuclease VapC
VTRGHLLGASALLALIFNEPGSDRVRDLIDDSQIHTVNLAEVMRKLVALGMPVDEVIAHIEDLEIETIPELNRENVVQIARLTPEAKRVGLSLGDCVCLVVAESMGLTAVTADRSWEEIQGRKVNVLQIR